MKDLFKRFTKQGGGDVAGAGSRDFDSPAFSIILAIAFLAPTMFLTFLQFPLNAGKGIMLMLIIVIAIFVWVVARLKDGILVIPKSLILAFLGFLPVVYLLAAVFSPSRWVSFIGLGFEPGTFLAIFLFTVLAYLTASLLQSSKRIYSLYLAILVATFVVFAYQLFHLIFGTNFPTLPASLVGSLNDLAVYSGFTALLSLATLELVSLSGRMKQVFGAGLVLSLVLMLFANLTIAWIVVGVFALILFVYSLSFNSTHSHGAAQAEGTTGLKLPMMPLIVVGLSLLLTLGAEPVGNLISNTFGVSNTEVRPSWIGTMEVVRANIAENPVFGSGPNRFVSSWLAFKPDGINQTLAWNVDFNSGVGMIPTFVVTTGLLGLLAWLLFFAMILVRGAQQVLVSPMQSKISRYLVVSAYLGAVYLWTMNIFYVPNVVGILLAFLMTGVLVGALAQAGVIKNASVRFMHDPRTSFISVLVLILMLLVSVAGGYSLLQRFGALGHYYDHVVALNVNGNIKKATNEIQSAIRLNETDLYYRSLSQVQLARINQLLQDPSVPEEDLRAEFQRVAQEAIANADNAVQIDPENYQNWIVLAQSYESLIPFGLPEGYERTRAAYQEAQKLNPRSPAIPFALARVELVRGNNEAAKQEIQKALEMKSNYTAAIFLLSQIQANEGDLAQAIESAQVATVVSPNDFGVYFQLGFLKYRAEDYRGAAEAFRRAIKLNNFYANAMYFLGLAEYELGNTEAAIAQFDRVQQLNPENAEVSQILSNLRSGQSPFSGTDITPPGSRDQLPIRGE